MHYRGHTSDEGFGGKQRVPLARGGASSLEHASKIAEHLSAALHYEPPDGKRLSDQDSRLDRLFLNKEKQPNESGAYAITPSPLRDEGLLSEQLGP